MTSIRRLPAAVLAATVVALAACQGEPETRPSEAVAPADVRVSPARPGADAGLYPARVVPVNQADVATRMAGTVSDIPVEVGDVVPAGARLATLDDADVQARIEAAEAQAELARRTFQRVENLARDGAASQQELDEARARLAAAEGGATEARAQAAYAMITAPFAGTVVARMADPGDLAAPGMPLMRLASRDVKVVADLPADRARGLSVGQRVEVELGHDPLAGRILRVVQALDPASRRIRVEIAVDGRPLPGALGRVRLYGGGGDGTVWIPADALVRSGQLTGVYAVERDTLRLRWVRLGRRSGDAVELLAGPAGEMTVVREPAPELRDGQAVGAAEVVPFHPGGAGLDGSEGDDR
ncbi:MAG TPA: efflux RND transporter periplasmic adaptor subunit [Longimicrobiales bacterium]|nr:efflux RND transporter periplasmic adaptor subunit [Longimicrobiales bacterium]